MINRDELLKIARDAGFRTAAVHAPDGSFSYHLVEQIGNGCVIEISRLVDIVLERAAVECEQEYYSDAGKELAEAVRALKTQ